MRVRGGEFQFIDERLAQLLRSSEEIELSNQKIIRALDQINSSINTIGEKFFSTYTFRSIEPPLSPQIGLQSVRELGLTTRATNALIVNKIKTVAQLVRVSLDELLSYKNMGKVSGIEIEQKLSSLGLRLGMYQDQK